jgi:hypothetical protein
MASSVHKVKAEVWLYPGMAGWRFVTLPRKMATEIKEKIGAGDEISFSLKIKT